MSENIDENESLLLQAMGIEEETIPNIPDYKAYAGKPLENFDNLASMFDIVEAIKSVSDPEIMINVYDMGLIYKIDQQENGNIYIEMTLTAPTCPVAGILPQEVANAISKVNGIGEVVVKVVWEPAWTIDRLSDEARLMLDMF